MSWVRTVARVVLVGAAVGTAARADQIDSQNSGGSSWSYFAGSTQSNSLWSAYADVSGNSVPSPSASGASSSTPSYSSLASSSVSAPVQTSPSSGSSSGGTYDALINFSGGNYLEASSLTAGTPQPWYDSPSVTKFFGGQSPNAQQQADFTNQVLQDVRQTYALSNLNPNITTTTATPNAQANHVLSVVSGASYGPNVNAIGITDVGANGFGFIDKLSYANSLTDLEWAVAHNVAHELMHAFGVGVHYDQTGTHVDAANATWSLLTDPNSTFSSQAAQAIAATSYSPNGSGNDSTSRQMMVDGDQEILAAVPEPATVALWSLGLLGVALYRRKLLPAS
jgi:hypothetical protein